MRTSFARMALACALFLAGAIAPAAAQPQTFDVSGTVVASDGTAISGASVTITAQSHSAAARTDAKGRFTLSGVTSGTYSVYAAAPGFQRLSQRTVTISPTTALSLVLSPATTNALTVIGQVRASSGETVSTSTGDSVTLNAQEAAAAGVPTVGAMVWNQLSTTPVIPLGGGSNATVTMAVRGPDPTETLVDIDGHQVNNGNTGDFDLSLVDPASLQAVQIIYGISPSSLLGPNEIGGAINILTLEPTLTPHAFVRAFGGSYNSFGETVQATGTDDRWGYAFSLHDATWSGSVNQSIVASAPGASPGDTPEYAQNVGSGMRGLSGIGKLRYQLGGPDGYGYLQIDFRNQAVVKDESALLSNYTPPNFSGGGDDAIHAPRGAVAPFDAGDDDNPGGFQSFAGTTLSTNQDNYGFDAQLPLGAEKTSGAPATVVAFSHLTTLSSQSVDGPGADTLPYLYNQRDVLTDDWLQIDHRFSHGDLALKYDAGQETLTTDYVQGQVTAEIARGSSPVASPFAAPFDAGSGPIAGFAAESLSQTQRSAVLRYNGDPNAQIHYTLAAYYSNFTTFGSSFDPRVGFTWTPTGNTAVRATLGTTFQVPQLSELVVPPPNDRVPVGGVIYIGNPNLQPDRATDMEIGVQQLFGTPGRQLTMGLDLYQTNLRSPANQLNVDPVIPCYIHAVKPSRICPISYPINTGNGTYRGIDVRADRQFGRDFHLRAGWDVDSSFLTVIPPSIQDGTLAAGEQSLGQPLHKAYFEAVRDVPQGWAYGARVNYEGYYNELNRSPYATLDAHVAYRHNGFEYGLYGTNLTNAYANPFTIVGGGVVYGGAPNNPVINPDAYALQGAKVLFVVSRAF